MDPVRGRHGVAVASREQALGQRVPAAVQRRRDQRDRVALDLAARSGAALAVSAFVGVVVGRLTNAASAVWNGCGKGSAQFSYLWYSSSSVGVQRLQRHPERAAEPQHPAELGVGDPVEVRSRVARRPCRGVPTRRSTGVGSSSRTRYSKSPRRAGAEGPAVVVRALRSAPAAPRRSPRPTTSLEAVAGSADRRGRAEPGQAAGLERRDEERVVGRVRGQLRGQTSREYARSGFSARTGRARLRSPLRCRWRRTRSLAPGPR